MLYTLGTMILSTDPTFIPVAMMGDGIRYAQLCNVMGAQHQAMAENGKNYAAYNNLLSDCNASIIQGRPRPAPAKPKWLSVLDTPAGPKDPNLPPEQEQPEPGTPIWVQSDWPANEQPLLDPIVIHPIPSHLTGLIAG